MIEKKNLQITDDSISEYGQHIAEQPRQFYCFSQTRNYDCTFREVVLDYNSVAPIFGNPQYTQYKKSVTFVDSRMEYLPKSLMDAFPNMNTLDASSLQIRSLQPAAFEFSNKLERLYLADNLIEQIVRESFYGAPSVAVLALERNRINYFEYYALGNMRNLRALYISSNEIPSLPGLSNSLNLEIVNASHNSLTQIDENHFSGNLELRQLDLSFNQLTFFNMRQLHAITKLISVDVSSNQLRELVIPTHVLKLFAINNSIEQVSTHLQRCFVQELSLAQNKLRQQPDLSVCGSLNMLDLSYNLLESFNFGSLQSMPYLTHVYLRNNHLLQIDLPTEFYYPLPITSLDLSSNMLSIVSNANILRKLDQLYLHNNKLEKFDFLNKPNLKSLTLSYNQWDCAALDGITFNIMDRQREQCTSSHNRGICCQSSDAENSQNLHKIKDLIREASIHELQNKKSTDEYCRSQIQQQLAMNEMNNRVATISTLEASKEPLLQEMSQVQDDLNQLDNQIADSQRETLAKNNQLALLAKEVDQWRATYGIEKEGLVNAREVLRRIVTFLEARKGNSNDLLKRRQEEVLAREGEKENKQTLANSGGVDLDQLKQSLSDLKVKEQALKTQRNALAAQVNRNSASIRGSSN
ncbi:probable serine/threonine-protein kinase roco9 isoform X2 [Culex quinquefasciatus]|uniref:probable serine/threonine-protein kinase roco9 isoform X2 n=1 Tax=Culex quinquefasciatus TaxID=7176 RepID=UPI0018E35152|nr:probable serine/threonine-protein kinase roco9 isoform X2 [Culex quinquefasciatus]